MQFSALSKITCHQFRLNIMSIGWIIIITTDRSAFFDVSFGELWESETYHSRESITARTLTISRGARCEEKSRGIHTALSHSERRKRVWVRPTKAADHGDSWEEVKVRFTANSAPHQHRRSTVFRLQSNKRLKLKWRTLWKARNYNRCVNFNHW